MWPKCDRELSQDEKSPPTCQAALAQVVRAGLRSRAAAELKITIYIYIYIYRYVTVYVIQDIYTGYTV